VVSLYGDHRSRLAAVTGSRKWPKTIQLGDLFAGVPLRPAGHIDPDLPDLSRISLEGCLAQEVNYAATVSITSQ
jgi:hypothetical protein